ncbi:MAG: hypothetical protein ACFFDB_00935 [Promethearchaeota archaeon]
MSEEWKQASWVSFLGMIAWILGIISGIIYVIWGLTAAITLAAVPLGLGLPFMGIPVWQIISGIIAILISFFIILPKFSRKCQKKDWEGLLNWNFNIGGIKFPWMLFWGIMLEIFSYGWGGFLVIVLSLVLLFAGPRKYDWK